MKKLLTILFFWTNFVHAANWYVDNTAGGTNSGTLANPWTSLASINWTSVAAGDSIFLKRGNVFSEKFVIGKSGTAGSHIIIAAYGTGAKPIISGFTSLTSWTNTSGNMWQSNTTITTASNIPMVTVNGVYQTIGTYPKSSYPTWQSHSGTTSITSNAISAYPSFVGGQVMIFPNSWTTDKYHVSAQTSTTVTMSYFIPTPEGGKNNGATTLGDGYSFVFLNSANACTAQGDWLFDSTSKKLSMYSVGSPTGVKIASIDTLVTINNKTYIDFSDIEITGANMYCVWIGVASSNNISFDSCLFSFSAVDGVFFRGGSDSVVTFNNCVLHDFNNIGIDANDAPKITIQNTKVYNVGTAFGVSQSGQNMYGITGVNANSLIQYCEVYNTGYTGIRFQGDNSIVQNCYVHEVLNVSADGGAIYTFDNYTPATYGKNKKILNNVCINSKGNGIYLDGDASYVLVQGNTSANCLKHGFHCNSGTYDTVKNNTFFNNYLAGLHIDQYAAGHIPVGWLVTNNIFFAKDSALTICFETESDTTNPTGWGTFDSNYYCRPIFEPSGIIQNPCFNRYTHNYCKNGGTIERIGPSNPYSTDYSLDTWQTFLGQDAHSKKSPKTVTSPDSILFVYNPTDHDSTITLTAIYFKPDSTVVNGSITLSAYSSAVLIYRSPLTSLYLDPTRTISYPGNNIRFSYNNPVHDVLTMNIPSGSKQTVSFDLSDIYGREFIKKKVQLERGSNEVKFDMTKLASALYILTMTDNYDRTEHFKILKINL